MSSLNLRVASRWVLTNTQQLFVHGGDRKNYLDQVWEMYRASYAKIGMHLGGPSDLLKYTTWQLFMAGETPVAFHAGTDTPRGLKMGVLGSDGSSEGKSTLKAWLRTDYHKSGNYGEVSHAVEKLTEGSPVVCVGHVEEVLKKKIDPSTDGVHYKRSLHGVGVVEKKMIGIPLGIPSGDPHLCPIPQAEGQPQLPKLLEKNSQDTRHELAEHAASLLFEDDEIS